MLLAAVFLGALLGGAQAPPAPGAHWQLVWDDRPSLQWGDRFRLDVRARFQSDAQWSPLFESGQNGVFALKRIGVRGHIGSGVTYQVDRELGVPDAWRDVYVNIRLASSVEVRAGQFKLPFGMDQNAPLTSLDFVYRSRIGSLIAPGRDPGVMIHGQLAGERVSYFAGGFTHDGRTARLVDQVRVQGGPTFAGRLLWRPRPDQGRTSGLQVGAATTVSDVPRGVPGVRGLRPIGGAFLLPEFAVDGRRLRTGLELDWTFRRWAARAEYAHVSTERRGLGAGARDLPPIVASGWYASAIWMATGEPASTGADVPARPVFRGGPGGVELGARVERLFIDDGDPGDPGRAAEWVWTLGATWYLNRWVKLQGSVIRERLTAQTSSSVWSQVLRFQLAF